MNTNLVLKSKVLTNANFSEEKVIGSKNDFDLPDNINITSVIDIIKNNSLSEDKLKDLLKNQANDNLFPAYTKSEDQQNLSIIEIEQKIQAEIKNLQTAPLSKDAYKNRIMSAQNKAAYLLIAECALAEELRAIPKKQGKHNNPEYKTKLQYIKDTYGLTRKPALAIQKLQWENVIAAITWAYKNEEIPTRSLALSSNKKIKNEKEANKNLAIDAIKLNLDPKYENEYKTLNLSEPLYATSLFACIGSGTSRLKELNIHCAVANEYLSERAEIHKKLDSDCLMIQGDIKNKKILKQIVAANKQKGCKLLLASPPCQVASQLNTAKDKEEKIESTLFYDTIKFIKSTHNDFIVIENVPQWLNSCPKAAKKILRSKDRKTFITIGEYMKRQLEMLGYNVNIEIVNAADYWTGEERKRCIILACKRKYGIWKFPKKASRKLSLWQVIGDLPSIEPGNSDPLHKWHYALPLDPCQIKFLAHTPTACSSFENAGEYQPVNTDGTPSKAEFEAAFTRLDWNKPCKTVTTSSNYIGGTYTLHPGYALTDGTYSDCRVLSILELLRIIGLPEDFLEPLDLATKNGMLSEKDDSFIREVLGEHVCPKMYNALMTTIPLENK